LPLIPCPAAEALPHVAVALRFADAADAEIIAALAIHVFLDTYATAGTLPDLAAEAFAEYSVAAFRARLVVRFKLTYPLPKKPPRTTSLIFGGPIHAAVGNRQRRSDH